jgi:hypothetical protein
MTPSIMRLSIATLSIMPLSIKKLTLNITELSIGFRMLSLFCQVSQISLLCSVSLC